MFQNTAKLLNIKQGEVKLVRFLFLIQFLLGAGIAFFSTAGLTLFLSTYQVTVLPTAYLLAGVCLLLFNYAYMRVEPRFSPNRLLQLAALFSAFSVLVCWLGLALFAADWLTIVLVIWNLVIYLLIGEAFWGVVAILFNVRESKRLFSIVGAGDIPAKLLGYLSVSALVPFIGVVNLLWVSVACFTVAFLLLGRYKMAGVAVAEESAHPQSASTHSQDEGSVIEQIFHNSLIFSISIWFLLAYTILLLIDYTFISEIKLDRTSSKELATFIAVFFAFGRLLAILFKLIFSSRIIARLGLTNSLLVAPALLILVNLVNLVWGEGFSTYLYIFGVMSLLAEVLRSTLQEPVSLALFQPLDPHSRLRGHLIAKGFTLPIALLGAGTFLSVYLQHHEELSVAFVSELLLLLLIVWAGSVLLIRRVYLYTLVDALRKGIFTGSDLFLNSNAVRDLLVQKTDSLKPQEVIHSLDLLEQSGYPGMQELLLRQLQNNSFEVKEYVLSRIIQTNMTAALPQIEAQLAGEPEARLKPLLVRAKFYLDRGEERLQPAALQQLEPEYKKAALLGLLSRPGETAQAAEQELAQLASGGADEKLMALDIASELRHSRYSRLVEALLQDTEPAVYNRAIEVVGKVRYGQLLGLAVEVAERHKAYASLQKALLLFGDAAFGAIPAAGENLSEPLLDVVLKTAGRVKGERATAFLEAALKRYPGKTDLVVEALWEKRATIGIETRQALEQWLDKKLNQSQLKKRYYLQLMPDSAVALLREAISSEIDQDIQRALKALALAYDQQRIERVIELYRMGAAHKLSNAVEMLELLVPKRYFSSLDELIEFRQDIRNHQLHAEQDKGIKTGAVIREILSDNRAGCNSWTRSVACYLIPRLQDKGQLLPVLDGLPENGDRLFGETKQYVVSMLSQV
jgi:hypothetical protein